MSTVTTKCAIPIDLIVPGKYEGSDPFHPVVTGTFTNGHGDTLMIPGFYCGNDKWAVRFSAEDDGDWTYKITSDEVRLGSDTAGLVKVAGTLPETTRLLRTDGTHFVDSKGAPVFILGHECNFLFSLVGSPGGHEKLEIFIENLKKGGFNQVQVNSYAVDASWTKGRTCANDFGPPYVEMWEETENGRRLNLAYFEEFDHMVRRLHENGIYAHIYLRVFNKFVQWPKKYSDADIDYYRYFIARYQAYPNMLWCISKEGYYENDGDYFYAMLTKIREWDAYGHLRTIHDAWQYGLDERYKDSIEYQTMQHHGEYTYSALYFTQRSGKPVINGEAGCECGPLGLYDTSGFPCWDPEQFCAIAYETFFGGAYFQYYHIYMAWDVIEYDLLPKSYRYYKQMRDFFSQFDLNAMRPAPELCPGFGAATCLDDGKHLLVYMEPIQYERYKVYTFNYTIMQPNSGHRKFKSYKKFGIFSGEYRDYVPTQPVNTTGIGYFLEENHNHMEMIKNSVTLECDFKEPVVIIIEYDKTN